MKRQQKGRREGIEKDSECGANTPTPTHAFSRFRGLAMISRFHSSPSQQRPERNGHSSPAHPPGRGPLFFLLPLMLHWVRTAAAIDPSHTIHPISYDGHKVDDSISNRTRIVCVQRPIDPIRQFRCRPISCLASMHASARVDRSINRTIRSSFSTTALDIYPQSIDRSINRYRCSRIGSHRTISIGAVGPGHPRRQARPVAPAGLQQDDPAQPPVLRR